MASASSFVFDVTSVDFDEKVLSKSREVPVVVDFWAPWCGPCRSLAPILERLVAQRNGEVLLAKVNTDEEQQLAMDYRIEALPTVVAFRDGKPILDFMGLLPESQLNEFLNRLAPSDADKQAAAAARVESTDPDEAERLYRKALAADPNQEAARLGLARILLDRFRDDEAAELIEPVGVAGEHGAEAERLGALIWLRQKANEATDEKSLRGKLDAEPNNPALCYEWGLRLAAVGQHQAALDALLKAGEIDRKLATGPVREAMVKIFQLVGVRSELADNYRDRLSALLY